MEDVKGIIWKMHTVMEKPQLQNYYPVLGTRLQERDRKTGINPEQKKKNH